jgi:hypothetical protein
MSFRSTEQQERKADGHNARCNQLDGPAILEAIKIGDGNQAHAVHGFGDKQPCQ